MLFIPARPDSFPSVAVLHWAITFHPFWKTLLCTHGNTNVDEMHSYCLDFLPLNEPRIPEVGSGVEK